MKLTINGQVISGQFALYAEKVLSQKDYYRQFMKGEINPAQFREKMLADRSLDAYFGNDKSNYDRIPKIPLDEKMPADAIFNYLVDDKIIPNCDNMYDGFDEYRQHIRTKYDHGDFFTCIFPEDERLIYAAARVKQPKEVFIAGAYYGYIAVWTMKTVVENGGMCVLSDIDEEVCRLASKNFEKLGYSSNSAIYCQGAEVLLANRTKPIDMLILDPTGNRNDPRPEYRGKNVYALCLKAAKHLLQKGSMIVVHNMSYEDPELESLVIELQAINALGTAYTTFNGLGVYVVL